LLSGDDDGKGNAGQLVYHAFRLGEGRELGTRSYRSNMHDLRAQPRDTPAPIPPEAYPLLVTFDDITKPETVREVDPSNLAATFGEGVSLRGMTLEVTEDKVTEGQVAAALPWLCDRAIDHKRLSGKTGAIFDNEISNRLGLGNFSVGVAIGTGPC
jgi:hypothetical protein